MDGIRNVALITVDCLRADHLPMYGYDRDTAPFLDDLASESTVFENAIAAGCGTPASFPSIFSSTFPFDYGGYNGITDERPYAPELISDTGITTGGFHSNTYLTREFGYGRGFDDFESFRSDDDTTSTATRISKAIDHESLFYQLLSRLYDLVSKPSSSLPYLPADELTETVGSWVESQAEPFFLWTHYMDPHAPHYPPERHFRPFGGDIPSWDSHQRSWRDATSDPSSVDRHSHDQFIDAYDAEIRFVDEQLSRLFGLFKDADQYENTLFVITADHGEGFGEHSFYGHPPRTFEELIHVPLVIHDPRSRFTQRVDEPVSLLSIAPTVLDAFDIDPPRTFRGRTLLDSTTDRDDGVFVEVCEQPGGGFKIQSYDRSRAVTAYRTHRFKYVLDNQRDQEILYDLSVDGDECHDAGAEYPEKFEELRKRVNEHLGDVRPAQSDQEVSVSSDVEDRMAELGYVEK